MRESTFTAVHAHVQEKWLLQQESILIKFGMKDNKHNHYIRLLVIYSPIIYKSMQY